MTYAELVERLLVIGINHTEVNVANELFRGAFSAVFMLRCLKIVG
ncbi:DUF6471 domain-containing protein [Roseovarius sp. MBR-51]